MEKDKSKQGFIDKDILPLINLLNSTKEYKTTSSCSGRIVLLKLKKIGDKLNSEWIYKTHKRADFGQINQILEKYKTLWFLQEPLTLHVKCKSLKSAEKLINSAQKSGLKHSGIISIKNYLVEIRGTERIETILNNNKKEYLIFLIEEANKKLNRTKQNMEKFYNKIKEKL
jgi:tRNA wybutosine-synthesizing protein 3